MAPYNTYEVSHQHTRNEKDLSARKTIKFEAFI